MAASAEFELRDEAAMRALGARLFGSGESGGVVTLSGELGSGKTTLVRGALQARGVDSGVRSPTYTLVEYYPFNHFAVAHFDLYRLGDPEELEYLGYRDYLNPQTLCLIEWPERARGYLHNVDLEISLAYAGEGRSAKFRAITARGEALLRGLDGSV